MTALYSLNIALLPEEWPFGEELSASGRRQHTAILTALRKSQPFSSEQPPSPHLALSQFRGSLLSIFAKSGELSAALSHAPGLIQTEGDNHVGLRLPTFRCSLCKMYNVTAIIPLKGISVTRTNVLNWVRAHVSSSVCFHLHQVWSDWASFQKYLRYTQPLSIRKNTILNRFSSNSCMIFLMWRLWPILHTLLQFIPS